MERETQNKKVLKYMERHGSITTAEAAHYLSIYRLSARIFDLRHAGYNIAGEWVTTAGRRYVRYRLEDDDEEEI